MWYKKWGLNLEMIKRILIFIESENANDWELMSRNAKIMRTNDTIWFEWIKNE